MRTLVTEHGIDQFLDLGSGVPTVGNVHEIAHAQNPHARVAYVDCEPMAVHHARHLLEPDEHHVTITQADVCDPETVLTTPGSALAVSNGAQLTLSPDQIREIHLLMADSSTPSGHWRDRQEVAALLPGYTLLEPGVVATAAWRPGEPVTDAEAARSNAYAAVGILPE